MTKIIAIAVADIHLSHNPPVSRAVEPDWLEAQSRPLRELRELQKKHDVPVLCAGDVFDRYNPNPELINFAIRELPKMYAVPGQHDLPNHQIKDVHRSAYDTLVEAGVILNEPDEVCLSVPFSSGCFQVDFFPFGSEVKPSSDNEEINIALVHSYIWIKNCSYPGALKENNLERRSWKTWLKGYDFAIFGDNHIPFTSKAGDCTVVNCGCLIRRSKDEREHYAGIKMLISDGTVETHTVAADQDKWEEVEEALDSEVNMTDFLTELKSTDSSSLDYRKAVERFIRDNKIRKQVEQELLRAMGD